MKLILDIFGNPNILIGLFTAVGLITQKKSVSEIIVGTLKAVLGFLILGIGADAIVGVLNNFGTLFKSAFDFNGVVPTNEAIVSLAKEELGRDTAIIMFLGMVMNIIFARITPFKYIFLTGHHTLFMACLLTAMLHVAHFNFIATIIVGSVLLGLFMVLSPAMLQPFTRKVTGSDELAMGHFGSTGYLVAALMGKLIGNPQKSTEDIKVSKNLMFLRDTPVAISLTMLALFIITGIVAGTDSIQKLAGGTNSGVFLVLQSIKFAAGVFIILTGVRMLISEIVPAFHGIADKIVPNAKPAIDCPMAFPYAPNAVIIGFLSSFVAGLASMFLLHVLHLTVIIPGLIPHFFTGAAAGVYGNATGGIRGSVVGAFFNGLIISFLPSILYPIMAGLSPTFKGTTFGDADFGVVGTVIGGLIQLFT